MTHAGGLGGRADISYQQKDDWTGRVLEGLCPSNITNSPSLGKGGG
jgi:hypothetical protein